MEHPPRLVAVQLTWCSRAVRTASLWKSPTCLADRTHCFLTYCRASFAGDTLMLDMEVIVRRQNQERCGSITCMIRHYVARRAQVTEGQPT
jgi:hypothetical protein